MNAQLKNVFQTGSPDFSRAYKILNTAKQETRRPGCFFLGIADQNLGEKNMASLVQNVVRKYVSD